jgi:arginase
LANPNVPADAFDGIAQGKMTMDQVVRVLGDAAKVVDVVGLGITEHLPWDALALKSMIARLPLIGTPAGQRS